MLAEGEGVMEVEDGVDGEVEGVCAVTALLGGEVEVGGVRQDAGKLGGYGAVVIDKRCVLAESYGVVVVVYGIDGEVECTEAVAAIVGGEVEAVGAVNAVGVLGGHGAVAVGERGVLAESDGIVEVIDGVDREVECTEAIAAGAGGEVEDVRPRNAVSYIGGNGAIAVGKRGVLTEGKGVVEVVDGIDGEIEGVGAVAAFLGGELEVGGDWDEAGELGGYGAIVIDERCVLAEGEGVVVTVYGVDDEVECAEAVATGVGGEVEAIGPLNAVTHLGGDGAVAIG